ncbi:uncharacterized protein LOC144548181 [Carex rostrata]
MCYFSPNFILLLLLIQAFLANCCIEHERDALLEFKAGVNDESGRLASWGGEKCCNWAGIRCNNRTSRVVKLNLRNTNMEPIYYEGNIPSKLTQLNNLQVLDLANNYLSGQLPRGLDNFTWMSDQLSSLFGYYSDESLIAMTKGLKLEYDSTGLLLWKSMDLSNNNLIGEIPREIVVLAGLLNLNLSNNHLIGNIPLEIGNMTSLESLDFHMNNLSGTIPQSISALYSLEKLNFSYNNLSGSIPTGYQLQALDDPSIYSGNPYLCGPPLETSCGSSGRFSHNNGNNDSNSKNIGDSDKWLYLFIEFGFVAGFLVVFFIILFKVKWRYTYFQMVDTVFDRLYVLMLKPKL